MQSTREKAGKGEKKEASAANNDKQKFKDEFQQQLNEDSEKDAKELADKKDQEVKKEEKAPDVLPEKLQTSTDNSELKFEDVVTGDFEVHDFKENPVFIGQYTGTEQHDGFVDKATGAIKDMLAFRNLRGQKVILNPSYQLTKLFIHRTSETVIDWDKNPVFRIQYMGHEDLGGGQSMATFIFQIAYK